MGLHAWQPGAPTLRWSTLGHENGDYGQVFGVGLSYVPVETVTLRIESERYTRIFAPGATPDAGSDAQVQSISLSVHF
jgi:hypothetical protein